MRTPDSEIMKQIDIYGKVFMLQGDEQKYYCVDTLVNDGLRVLGVYYIPLVFEDRLPQNYKDTSVWRFLPFNQLYKIRSIEDTLSGPYSAASNLEYAYTMNLVTPDTMDKPIAEALRQLKQAVGNVQEFVAERLHYSLFELSEVLSNEQIDAVAMAIYNAEVRNQGMIIGDQTGVGKGRIAAALLRYAVEYKNEKPIFFTVKKDLFADIIRDLNAIHCNYELFTTNSDGNVKDDDGNFLLKYNESEAKKAYKNKRIPSDKQIMLTTYSQIPYSDKDEAKEKRMFFESVCYNNILVMDEAHKAGGEGFVANMFVDKIVPNANMVVYLSATFAKRPDNMPVYAVKTCIQDAFPDKSDISDGIKNIFYYGGNAVEEIASSTLVEYGQMLRRERKGDDVTTNFITLDAEGANKFGVQNEVERHTTFFNNVSSILKKLRLFEMRFVDPYIDALNERFKQEDKWDYTPISDPEYDKNKKASRTNRLTGRLFNIMNVAMFALKAEAVGKRAVDYLKKGYKPVVGFASTLASVIPSPDNKTIDDSERITPGSNLEADLMDRFRTIYPSLLKYQIRHKGKEEHMKKYEKDKCQDPKFKIVEQLTLSLEELDYWWEKESFDSTMRPSEEWDKIVSSIQNDKLGIPISPIDVIRKIIENAGYSVAECTGRDYYIEYDDTSWRRGVLLKRKDNESVTKKYNSFNDNEKDCLFINSSASTGKSAHAIPTKKVTAREVKKRVLLIVQAESDINEEIQKRGRVNRTGQIYPPTIEYIFSFLPPERKLKAMLKRKLKSLSANTSANQDADAGSLEGEDIYNVFGDSVALRVAKDLWYDEDEPDMTNMFIDNPLDLRYNKKIDQWEVHASQSGFAQRIFNCIQLLPIDEQERFLSLFYSRYAATIERAKEEGYYFLETSKRDYQATLINEYCIRQGNSEKSRFGSPTFMSVYSIRSQKKLPKSNEIGTSLVDESDIILKNIEFKHKQDLEDIEKRFLDSKPERLEKLKTRIDAAQKTIESQTEVKKELITMLSDKDMGATIKAQMKACDDKIEEQKTKIKEYEESIKNLDADIETSIKTDQDESKKKYSELKYLINSFKVGSVFRFNDGNLYMVSSLKASNSDIVATNPQNSMIDYFSRPSDISVKMVTTDTEMASGLELNFANSEEKRNQLLEIANYERLTAADWDNFINSDKFREKAYIITGNIIPYIKYDLKGAVVRFSLSDGTEEVGFQVKLERDETTNRLKLPERVAGVAVPILKHKNALTNAIFNNNSRVDFIHPLIDNGECYLSYDRQNDDKIEIYLFFSAAHREKLHELNYDYVSGDFLVKITDMDWFLEFMDIKGYSVLIPFALLDQYGIELGGEKYQMQDWKPLSYDKNKIPKQPKNYLHKLFVKL